MQPIVMSVASFTELTAAVDCLSSTLLLLEDTDNNIFDFQSTVCGHGRNAKKNVC